MTRSENSELKPEEQDIVDEAVCGVSLAQICDYPTHALLMDIHQEWEEIDPSDLTEKQQIQREMQFWLDGCLETYREYLLEQAGLDLEDEENTQTIEELESMQDPLKIRRSAGDRARLSIGRSTMTMREG
jgi:hypothetical protein